MVQHNLLHTVSLTVSGMSRHAQMVAEPVQAHLGSIAGSIPDYNNEANITL